MSRAAVLAQALGGHRVGRGFVARCPAHDDHEPSLAIDSTDGDRVLVHCHAGCLQGEVIRALRALRLWDVSRKSARGAQGAPISSVTSDAHDTRRSAALALWRSAQPAAGTLVEKYLSWRGLELPTPPTLRFHPRLRHPSGGAWPAMIGLVTRGDDDTPVAVHRTYLAPEGLGKAPLTPARLMLGHCRGGAVRLADHRAGVLAVAEGIETALSTMQATGYPVWAALSTTGLRALILPENIVDVIVLADGDAPGEAAAKAGADRWKREGRKVRIARPPRGMDFNDLLRATSGSIAEIIGGNDLRPESGDAR